MKKAVVVGLGGCGINSVLRMCKEGVGAKAVFVTDDEERMKLLEGGVNVFVKTPEVKGSPVREKDRTKPIPRSEIAKTRKRLETEMKGAKIAFIFAGLGGRLGTSLLEPAATAAKRAGAKPKLFLTFPFKIERRRVERSKEALEQLGKLGLEIHLYPNDAMIGSYGSLPMNEAFRKVDSERAAVVKAILG